MVAALILQHEQSADRVGGGTTRITEERQRILKTEMEVASDLDGERRDFMRAFVMAGAAVALGVGVALVRRQLRRASHLDRLRLEHVSETARLYRNAGTRILILGVGFGGLSTALKLDQQLRYASDTSVLVVGRDNDMLFNPLLWTVANGRTNPNDAVVPIRDFQKERRFHVLQAEVEHIDLERKEVQTSVGIRPYDKLV
ncbi:MAG: hypothetical protein ACJ8AG_04405, partial [Ktedonobacteraceae bacterium]